MKSILNPLINIGTTLGLAFVLSLTAVSASAEGKRKFDRFDTNGDGVISFNEFEMPKHRGRKADLNEDGQVTREEVNEHAQARSQEMLERASQHFSRMDLNGDDVVTPEEAKEAMFYRLDKDGDGYLSPKELKRPERRPGKR